jgi:hypothetical protein
MEKGLKKIGQGEFTQAYLREADGKVVLRSCCPIKECMAHADFPAPLFPKIKMVRVDDTDLNYYIYEMEYYPKVRSLKNNLDPDQYQIYKDLRNIDYVSCLNPHDLYSRYYEEFEKLENEDLREAMLDALNDCANFGSDIAFEISPRNVATKNGKLILLDCFLKATGNHRR